MSAIFNFIPYAANSAPDKIFSRRSRPARRTKSGHVPLSARRGAAEPPLKALNQITIVGGLNRALEALADANFVTGLASFFERAQNAVSKLIDAIVVLSAV